MLVSIVVPDDHFVSGRGKLVYGKVNPMTKFAKLGFFCFGPLSFLASRCLPTYVGTVTTSRFPPSKRKRDPTVMPNAKSEPTPPYLSPILNPIE